jgi:predicted molibdopterin-dependent oxidoreductase YjgC
MKLLNDIGSNNIKEVIESHPRIGEILEKHEIGCTKCTVGTCLLQDVVSVHFLGDEAETQIEKEINSYLEKL